MGPHCLVVGRQFLMVGRQCLGGTALGRTALPEVVMGPQCLVVGPECLGGTACGRMALPTVGVALSPRGAACL